MWNRLLSLFACSLLVMVSACRQQAPAPAESTAPSRSFSVTGMVQAVHPVDREVVVKHQDIPGYMDAMTMPFTVRDTNELRGLIPGEEITFQMRVTKDDAWIEHIQKTGVAENILPKGMGIRIARDVELLEVGDRLPDYAFVNEQGQHVRLSQYTGDALVLSFLFTRCPLPQFCPLTARKLVETQDRLLADTAGPTNWHILAITIDPEYDTPERLRQFGESYGQHPARMNFLTGELIDITALAEQFGLLFWTEDGTVNHNLRTVVVGADGVIRTNIIGNEWAVETLVSNVVAAATPAP